MTEEKQKTPNQDIETYTSLWSDLHIGQGD